MKRLLQALCLSSLSLGVASGDIVDAVKIDTTPLNGSSGYLAFDFIGGSPAPSNTVTISNFLSDSSLGALIPSGDAFGTISPGPGILKDSQFFNELLQTVNSFGNTVSFTLDLTTNTSPGGIPDAFSLFVLNSMQDPIATSDPTGADSLIFSNIDGPNALAEAFVSTSATATVTPASPVPEPRKLAFPITIILALAVFFRHRPVRSRA